MPANRKASPTNRQSGPEFPELSRFRVGLIRSATPHKPMEPLDQNLTQNDIAPLPSPLAYLRLPQ